MSKRRCSHTYIYSQDYIHGRYSLASVCCFSTLTPGHSGECAGHFRKILNKYPPQVRTRSSAAAWACHVHNEVNKSLKKPLFDCLKIGDFYDCGCAEDEDEDDKKGKENGDAVSHGLR